MIHVQETRRRLLEGNLHPCSYVTKKKKFNDIENYFELIFLEF